MPTITYSDITIDTSTLPEASLVALLSRGLTHLLGNEISSKVHSWACGEAQANSDDRATVKAWKEANAEAVSAKVKEFQSATIEALAAGTIGTRAASGTSIDPIERRAEVLARKEVVAVLTTNSIKVPKGEQKVKMGDAEFTMAELVDRRMTKYGERLRAEAKRELDAEAKAKTKLAEKVGSDLDL